MSKTETQTLDEVRQIYLELSDPQMSIFCSTKALNLDMAGQRAGKSQMIGILSGHYITWFPRLKGFIAANTYMQLTQSTLIKATEIWRDYYGLTEYDKKSNPNGNFVIDKRPPAHFITHDRYKDYNNIISFANGGVIFIGSLDNYKAHDGKEFAWAHLDETKDTKEVAVTNVILARLSQPGLFVDDSIDPLEDNPLVYLPDAKGPDAAPGLRSFNPCWIHTSPAIGQVDWLIKMFKLSSYADEIAREIVKPEGWFELDLPGIKVVIFSTHHNAPNLPANYIAGRIAVLSENEQMKFIFGYPFSKTGSEYFPKFERIKHVRKAPPFNPNIAAQITLDFNVMPYMTLLSGQIYYQMRWMDAGGTKHDAQAEGLLPIEVLVIQMQKEYCLKSPLNSTEAVCNAWADDHRGFPGLDMFYYGDASGQARIEGLGDITNFKILERVLWEFITDGSKRVKGTNIGVLKRRDLLNQILEGKHPTVELYLDEEMEQTIRDMEFLKLAATGKLKEKAKDPDSGAVYEKIGHTSDALEYLVCEVCRHLLTSN